MKFLAVAALIAGTLAMPTADIDARTNVSPNPTLCPNGLYSYPFCADANLLGLACLNAVTPAQAPRDANNFREICASVGKKASCAVLGVAGQALLCQAAPGTGQ